MKSGNVNIDHLDTNSNLNSQTSTNTNDFTEKYHISYKDRYDLTPVLEELGLIAKNSNNKIIITFYPDARSASRKVSSIQDKVKRKFNNDHVNCADSDVVKFINKSIANFFNNNINGYMLSLLVTHEDFLNCNSRSYHDKVNDLPTEFKNDFVNYLKSHTLEKIASYNQKISLKDIIASSQIDIQELKQKVRKKSIENNSNTPQQNFVDLQQKYLILENKYKNLETAYINVLNEKDNLSKQIESERAAKRAKKNNSNSSDNLEELSAHILNSMFSNSIRENKNENTYHTAPQNK